MHLSYHVIVHSRLSLSKGLRGVAAGANPSLVSGRGQGTPWARLCICTALKSNYIIIHLLYVLNC